MTRLLVGIGVLLLIVVVGFAPGAPASSVADPACSVSVVLPPIPTNRPRYGLHIVLDRSLTRASGSLTVSFRPEVATDRLVFRLWPNSPAYAARGARLAVEGVTSGGRSAAVLRPNATTLVVMRAVAAGERVTISMKWALRLARGDGLQLHGGGSMRLVSFFPILAWDGSGWATDPAGRSDSFWPTSPTADFDVRVVVPKGLRVLASGKEIDPGRWRAQGVRDFALAVGVFTVRTTTVRASRPIRLVVGLEQGSSYPIEGFVADTARALRTYARLYGGYPWPTHTLIVMKDLYGLAGFAYPTVGFIGDSSIALIPHETAHQWFYSLIGNNQARDPWLSEGLATWAQTRPERSLPIKLATLIPPDVRNRIGEPMSFWERFPVEKLRSGLYVQSVQALGALGDEHTVDCALRLLVRNHAYGTITPRDLLTTFEQFFPNATDTLTTHGARF